MERVSDFVTLTREGGQSIVVNVNQIAFVQERADERGGPVLHTADGIDFEVTESFGDVMQLLVPPETPGAGETVSVS